MTDDREERHTKRPTGRHQRDARPIVRRGVLMLIALLALAITLAIVFENHHIGRAVMELGRLIARML